MPAVTFLAVVGLALIAMLFVADATLPDPIRNLTTATAPASDLVRAAMPETQSASEDLAKVDPAARAARAEAPPTKKRITRTQPPGEYRRNNTWSQSPGAAREFGLSGFN
jgi:predicted component of type VI protein secretion system